MTKHLDSLLKEKLRGTRKEPIDSRCQEPTAFFHYCYLFMPLMQITFLWLRSTIGKHNIKLIIVLGIVRIPLLKKKNKNQIKTRLRAQICLAFIYNLVLSRFYPRTL